MHPSLACAALVAALTVPALAQQQAPPQPAADGPIVIDPSTGEPVLQAAKEPPKLGWSGALNAGGSLSSGNTNRRSASASADAQNRGEDDRLTLGASWNYADEKDPVTREWDISQRKTRGNAKYDYFLTEKLYLFAGISAENDKFSDLKLRLIVSAGAGYQFVEREDLKLSGEAGIAYYKEDRYVAMDDDYPAAKLAYHLEWAIRENVKLLQDVEAIPSLEDKDDIYVHGDTRLRLSVTEKMFTQLQWVIDYDNTPATGLDRIDNLYVLSVGWAF